MKKLLLVLGMLAFSACGKSITAPATQTTIRVTATETVIGESPAYIYAQKASVGDVISIVGSLFLAPSDNGQHFQIQTASTPGLLEVESVTATPSPDNAWLVSFTVKVMKTTQNLGPEQIWISSDSTPGNYIVASLTVAK
jgi:hypothetical protein